MLTAKRALPVLEVVLLGLVGLYAVKEEIAGLLEERVNAEIERVKIGCERVVADLGVAGKVGQRLGKVDGGLLRRRLRELVEEAGQEMGVVDADREFDKDVLVTEVGLLQAVNTN